jgi:parallel beta-helix repeat protein
MKKLHLLLLALPFVLGQIGCSTDTNKVWRFTPANTYEEIQTALTLMEDGDIVEFSAGTFQFSLGLSLDGKNNIVFRGAGREETVLDFSAQITAAQSIYASDCTWLKFQDFTVKDPLSDGIKVKDSDGVTFLRVGVTHSNPIDPTNGGYGLYPVTSLNVLVDDCYIFGCSDAGVYVGQSQHVIVRNCEATGNVLGIEIENCIESDVYDNHCHANAGGMLITDLPGLPVIKNGNTCRVYDNLIENNDLVNFAAAGNTVAFVPPGTGILVLAANKVEIFGNDFRYNNVLGVGVASYQTLLALGGLTLSDTLYNPYSGEVNIHDNLFVRSATYPTQPNDMGSVIQNDLFPNGDAADIIFDGFYPPELAGDATRSVCVKNNGSATFSNIDVPMLFANLNRDAAPHDCQQPALPAAVVNAPE